MKKLLSLGMVAMLAMTVLVSSCGKYEEGSKFTLLTAKSRLVNSWSLTAATSNGTSVFAFMPTIVMDIKKDDTYSMSYSSGGLTTTETGKWAFNSDKTNVVLTATDNSTSTFKIIMLKSKDLKLQDADAGTTSTDIYTFAQK